MGYAAKIIADSISPDGARLTTFELTYPRFIHAELMTHRLFSRNSASSRAIPTAKLMGRVRDDPAMPLHWGKNQAGMQARQELNDGEKFYAEEQWLLARNKMLDVVERLNGIGLHKQIANRLLEPWMFITVIVTATEWDNFFHLRCHPDAQPELQWVATEMRKLLLEHVPRQLRLDDWHLPFITPDDLTEIAAPVGWAATSWEVLMGTARKISVARCARVSYLTHDGRKDFGEDFRLHDQLLASGHWSPFEHVAQPLLSAGVQCGNFRGWRQYRKFFANEAGPKPANDNGEPR